VKLVTLPLDRGVADMDLTLYLQEKDGSFYGYFEYSTALFEHSTIELLASRFRELLRALLDQPEAPLSRVIPFEASTIATDGVGNRLRSMLNAMVNA
jgi:hypothetical protein